jgi:hypothetical protein
MDGAVSNSRVCEAERPNHSDHTHADPEHVQNYIGGIFLDEGAPREHHRVRRVKNADKQKRARGTEPTYQREAEYPHQGPDNLDGSEISSHGEVQLSKSVHGNLT